MVFFTCSGCGESLKKNKVDAHLLRCRHFEYLTCIDCSKDFSESAYKHHITCITEDEKYGKTGFKSDVPKGQLKQQEWKEKIDILVSKQKCLDRQTTLALSSLLRYDNIPRKKGKFLNFAKTSLRCNPSNADKMWNLLNAAKSDTTDAAVGNEKKAASIDNDETKLKTQNRSDNEEQNDNHKENIHIIPDKKLKKKRNHEEKEEALCNIKTKVTNEQLDERNTDRTDKKSSKKRKREKNNEIKKKKVKLTNLQPNECDEVKSNTNASTPIDAINAYTVESMNASAPDKFPWKKAIKTCLRSSTENQLALKKLRKKIWNEYNAFEQSKENKRVMDEGKFNSLLLKKIDKNPKFQLRKEKVKLVK